jgi:hypothetical protein
MIQKRGGGPTYERRRVAAGNQVHQDSPRIPPAFLWVLVALDGDSDLEREGMRGPDFTGEWKLRNGMKARSVMAVHQSDAARKFCYEARWSGYIQDGDNSTLNYWDVSGNTCYQYKSGSPRDFDLMVKRRGEELW